MGHEIVLTRVMGVTQVAISLYELLEIRPMSNSD